MNYWLRLGITLLFLKLNFDISGQEFHPEILKHAQPKSNILFESRNGFKLP